MSHTPGPWIFCRDAMNTYSAHVVDKKHDCIALLDSRGGLATPREIEANAHLIAASPDLLEACEEALGNERACSLENAGNMYGSLRDKLEAAIKKARGES